MLSVKDLNFSYGDATILNNINLNVESGQFFCILGKSGCGKSTLLRLISGLEKVSLGEVSIENDVISSAKTHIEANKRGIGYVFQDGVLFPHMTIEKQITMVSELQNKKNRTIELAKMLHIEQLLNSYPHQLSGGEQQRCAIARTLAMEPKLLLMDEPFSSLDPLLRKELGNEIKNLLTNLNITTVFVTHDQNEAFMLSDKIAFMHNGNVLQSGLAYDLYNNPINLEVANFIGEGSVVEGVMNSNKKAECGFGEITIHSSKEFNKGDKVKLFFRPDVLSVSESKSGQNLKVIQETFTEKGFSYQLQNELSEKYIYYSNIINDKLIVGDSYNFEVNRSVPILEE
jgi:iron(III) transport system ATP-binding protein